VLRLTDFRLYALLAALSLASSLAGVLVGRAPVRAGADEFSLLLGGQTFAAGRLTNPTHPHWKFFETFHVLARPSYMAKYPPAQSLALAVGYKLGHPIIGVWLTGIGFALATAWLLRARLAPRWALLGGSLVVLQFGTTHYYSQSYWGGAIGATAGALVLGATLRLSRKPSAIGAAGLGVGVAMGFLSRPFETALLCVVPGILCLKWLVAKTSARPRYRHNLLLVAAPIIVAGLLFQAGLNRAVTGHWWRLPYTAYEMQYSGAPLFSWQKPRPAPEFHNPTMAIFHTNFVMTASRFESSPAIVWVQRLYDLLLASLGPVLALVGVLGCVFYPTRAVRLVCLIIGVSSVGFILSYWFFSHYYAGLQGAFVLLGIHGLRFGYLRARTRRLPFGALVVAVLAVCAIPRVMADEKLRPLVGEFARTRQNIEDELIATGENHLIFVRRLRPFNFHFMWVYNNANIDGSTVVWAHDRGPEENQQLIDYYRGQRRVWLMLERNDQPRLLPWSPQL
jgi:hypothetical protein